MTIPSMLPRGEAAACRKELPPAAFSSEASGGFRRRNSFQLQSRDIALIEIDGSRAICKARADGRVICEGVIGFGFNLFECERRVLPGRNTGQLKITRDIR